MKTKIERTKLLVAVFGVMARALMPAAAGTLQGGLAMVIK